MIAIRPYRKPDRKRLLELNLKQGREQDSMYLFADPDDPQQYATLIAEDAGRIVAAVSGRICAEGFLTLDTDWGTPAEKWDALQKLYRAGAVRSWEAGMKELHACVPANQRGYAHRLVRDVGFTIDPRLRLVLDLEAAFGTAEEAIP